MSGRSPDVRPRPRRRRPRLRAADWAGGSAVRRSSRRTSPWPTSASTSSARRASLLAHAGALEGDGRGEDDLAYWRDEREFRCVHLVERAADRLRRRHGPAAGLRDATRPSCTPPCSAAPTRRWPVSRARPSRRSPTTSTTPTTGSLRLGDGTDESHARMQTRARRRVALRRGAVRRPVDPGLVEAGIAADPTAFRVRRPRPGRRGPRRGDPGRARGDAPARRRSPRPAHRGPRLRARRDAAPRPLAPGGALVSPQVAQPGLGAGRRGARPRDPGRHHRGPRHPARRDRGRPGLGARPGDADLLRLSRRWTPSPTTWWTG